VNVPWLPHPDAPIDAHNPVPYYVLEYDAPERDRKGRHKRTCACFTDKGAAEARYSVLHQTGRNPIATVQGIAGFA